MRVLTTQPSQVEAEQAKEDREQQATLNGRMYWATFWIAAFTAILAGVGFLQWRTHNATLRANKVVERAYVKVSHEWAPQASSPLTFVISHDDARLFVGITIKNEGNTPADVLSGGLWTHIADAPRPPTDIPQTIPVTIDPAFLTGGGGDFIRDQVSIAVPDDLITHFRDSRSTVGAHLWLIGYVDYRDRFGDLHRTGYCRHFDNASKDLVFDQTTSGLNYDRPLTRHERRRYRAHQQQQ